MTTALAPKPGAIERRFHWTLEDYHRAIEAGVFDDRRVELLAGELYEMPPKRLPHIRALRYLARRLGALIGQGIAQMQLPIVLPHDSEPEPDLFVLSSPAAPEKPTPEWVLLVIEVADASRRVDRGRKRRAYLRDGIRELWIIDLVAQEVLRYVDGVATPVIHRGDGVVLRAGRADVSLDVDELFAAALGTKHD
jgi:Uma2 family endonuclease